MLTEKISVLGLKTHGEAVNIITPAAVALCCEYSENPDALKEIIAGLDITASLLSVESNELWQDKKPRARYSVAFSNGLKFSFWQSLNFWEIMAVDVSGYEVRIGKNWIRSAEVGTLKTKEAEAFLHSVLCCVKSDSYCPETFEEFCCEYGYDTDSIKAETTFRECREQAHKIRRAFTMDQLENFPS